MSHADAGDQPLYSRRLLTAELRVLEINVVNDLSDGTESRISEPTPLHQNFQRAAIAFVREFGVKHVKAEFTSKRLVVFCRHKLEAGV